MSYQGFLGLRLIFLLLSGASVSRVRVNSVFRVGTISSSLELRGTFSSLNSSVSWS